MSQDVTTNDVKAIPFFANVSRFVSFTLVPLKIKMPLAPPALVSKNLMFSMDEPPAVPAGDTEDQVSDWGLELEAEESEAPARPSAPQPIAESSRPIAPAPIPVPPIAPPPAPLPAARTPEPVAPGPDAFNWSANRW